MNERQADLRNAVASNARSREAGDRKDDRHELEVALRQARHPRRPKLRERREIVSEPQRLRPYAARVKRNDHADEDAIAELGNRGVEARRDVDRSRRRDRGSGCGVPEGQERRRTSAV